MAKTPVRVKPNVLQSNALKIYSAQPVDGAKHPAELSINTNSNDMVKVQVNFKRTPSGDTSELELSYDDFTTFLEALRDSTDSSEKDIDPVFCAGMSHFAGGSYSETPNPAGSMAFGRNGGVFWLNLTVGNGKPVVQFPLLNTKMATLQNKEGTPVDKEKVSKWATRSFIKTTEKHLAIAMADRYIPWQHKAIIKEGKPTPYSDPKVNYSYINTFNPQGNAGGGNAPAAPAALPSFDMKIPF